MRTRTSFVLFVLAFAALARAGQLEQEGYQIASVAIAQPGVFLGGFDVLPDGNYVVFDGTDVVELDQATGQKVGTLFTPPAPVFGSFVRVGPDHQHFYFGESSNGVIWEVPIAGGSGRSVTTVAFNYDMEFDPSGRAFVSAASGAFGESYVHLVDLASGQLDEIAHVSSFSGPLSFDGHGNLYLGQPDDQFPPRAGFNRVLLYSKAQVDGAIGPTSLTDQDALFYVDQLDGIFDMDFDGDGDLLITDPWNGFVTEVEPGGASKQALVGGAGTAVFTYARSVTGTRGIFEPFQPQEGGLLAVVEAPFSGASEAAAVRPLRPTAATQPGSPIPPGPFTFSIADGPSGGAGLLLLADDTLGSEISVKVNGIPLLIGIDPTSFRLALPFALDGTGGLTVHTENPGLGGVTIAVQALVAHTLSQPLGTSNALAITFN